MSTVLTEHYGKISIPAWVVDLPSFLRWIDSAELPEKLPVRFLKGEVWVDLQMEELFSHNQIKTALGIALGGLIEREELGLYVSDGMLLINKKAQLATKPDGMFFSNETLASKRFRFVAGKKREGVATRIIGSPDLAIEIISASSEEIDEDWLLSAYFNAGVREYWVIDARDENDVRFDIFKHGKKGYALSPKQESWSMSPVLGRFFRLSRKKARHGLPSFKIEVRK